MRAELARVLASNPAILLLDEPSNYLDIPAIEWLQKFLRDYAGTLIMISHDRFLLNSLTTVTIEVAHGRAERYEGNYDTYVRQREVRYHQRLAAQRNQERQREKLETFIERFKAKSTKAAQAQSKMKMLARLDAVELPKIVVSPGRIRLRPPPHCGVEVVRLENAGLTYDNVRWVLQGIDLRLTRGEKVALVGFNGLGKTTLLRMLAGRLPLSEGKRVVSHNVVIGYQSQDFAETMDPGRTVYEMVKSVASDVSDQETRTLLGGFGFSGDAIDKNVGVLSGGEKIRVAFARLLIKPPNFLVLDEPTTHLDIQARERLEEALQNFEGTMCVVSHDIDFRPPRCHQRHRHDSTGNHPVSRRV
jgi:ATP-binding cassette, subfamily F, member 3